MELEALIKQIRACTNCADSLPLGPNPVFRISPKSKLLIIGQAPGTRVHNTGVPWNDPSGIRLRNWLGMEPEEFYNEDNISIIPMGLCYPGRGKSGDNPPRPECAPLWHNKLVSHLPDLKLKLLIGQYAINTYLKDSRKPTLTETVRNWEEYLPLGIFPLVHPSPRNTLWLHRNPWFEKEVVPELRKFVHNVFMEKTLVIITGGTIDAEPYATTPKNIRPLTESRVPQLLQKLDAQNYTVHQWDMKDSKDFSEDEITKLASFIKSSDANRVIITHGTDAMVENAKLLQKHFNNIDKKIIFTGAMEPLTHGKQSDGEANLSHALTAKLTPGIYIIGREEVSPGQFAPGVFLPNQAQKDFARKVFIRHPNLI